MKAVFYRSFCLAFLLTLFILSASAQTVVDKMLVTVSDGVRTELITYSDVIWQLAMQPDASLDAPSKDDMNAALERLKDQRLIALEAERLPAAAPTDAEITTEIRRIVAAFPSAAVFEARLRRVGFESTDDPNFRRIIERRLAIEKYLDFRFRSFIVITPQDEERYYGSTFVPEFRRSSPGVVVPPLESVRRRINEELTEAQIEFNIQRFITEARERAIITTLNPV